MASILDGIIRKQRSRSKRIAGFLMFSVSFIVFCGTVAINSSHAAMPPIELTSLTIQNLDNSVRIQASGNQSLEGVTIDETTGAGEATFRILGVRSRLKPIYEINNALVKTVRTQAGERDDKPWVEIKLEIAEGTAVTFQQSSNGLVIEAVRTSYVGRPRAPINNQRVVNAVANPTAVVKSRSSNEESKAASPQGKGPAKSDRPTTRATGSPQRAPTPVKDKPIQFVDLTIRQVSGRPQIDVVADGPVRELVIEQSVGAGEAVLRIRGVHSSLQERYSTDQRSVHGVRILSGGPEDAPWLDIIIEIEDGAAIAFQKNANRLEIGVSRIAYFRPGSGAKDNNRSVMARSNTSPTQNSSAASPAPAKPKLSDSQSAPKIAPKADSSSALRVANASSKQGSSSDVTVSVPEKQKEGATTSARASESKADSSTKTESQPRLSDVAIASNNVSPKPAAPVADKPLPRESKLAEARGQVPTKSPNLIASTVGQQGAAQLHGVVIDEQGALIVGASVILDDGHGHKYETKTDDQGRYGFKGLVASTYVLTASYEGFGDFKTQVEIDSQKIAALDVTLKISISAQVEVRAAPSADLTGMIFTQSDIASLPKDPTQLLRKLKQMASMMGIPDAAITVDGSPGDRLPPREDIQMIKISPHSFAAEYAQPASGQIDVTSKPSGHFHGDFSFNFNDEALNARDPFAPNRAPLQIREYNAYVSGPLIPGRWSFSAYLGRYDRDENSVIDAIVLDPATLLATPFNAVALTPSRDTYVSFGTSYLLNKKHAFRIKYSGVRVEQRNQGVGKFDLPERAYNDVSRNSKVAFSVTSIFSENKINELHLQLSRTNSNELSFSSAPAILVLDSFNKGGNQESLFKDDTESSLSFSDTLSYPRKNHLFKAGIGLSSLRYRNTDRSNFGGTFVFGGDVERDGAGNPILDAAGQPITITSLERYRRTLLGLPGYHPSQFSIVRGNPLVGLCQSQMLWFVQDDWKLSSRLVLSYGLRHGFQTNIKDTWNFAPRLGLAWRPSSKRSDTLRAGLGVFYDNVGSNITFDTNRLDGQHQQEITTPEPAFFPDVPATVSGGVTAAPTIRTKDSDLKAPSSLVSMISYQPQLPWGLSGSVSYNWQRGWHLLRSRNINAPIPGAAGLRPFMKQGPILQFESTGRLHRSALEFSLSRDITSKLSLSGAYNLSFTRSDTDDPYSVPANPYNLSSEFGWANGDRRHRVRLEAWSSLPGGFNLSPYFSISSGAPFNITTGRDENGDTLFADRPSFSRVGDPGAVVTRFGVFNPNPTVGDQIIPRNFGRRPHTVSSGLNLSRSVSFGSGGDESIGSIFNRARRSVRGPYNLTFSLDVENFFNHTNLSDFNGVLTSPFFGRANSSEGARKVKIGLELSFE